ncbi:hypothetical protein BBJ28_00000040 [Nothophytophthora sp. Chile5]|nr:hypothetical protein BBJ28_00000040 [Nothophytophthora sp. Chile5]
MAAFIQDDGTLKGRYVTFALLSLYMTSAMLILLAMCIIVRGRCGTPGFVAPEILAAGKGEAYPSGVDMFSAGVVTYTMLCGYEPFFGVNDEELIQMNKRVEYEFEEPEWSSISDEAKDLVCADLGVDHEERLTRVLLELTKDTDKRITFKQALEHPFLRDANMQLDDIFREQAPISPTRLL